MNILIIEDEPLAARRLTKLLKELLPNANVVAQLDSISESILFLESSTDLDLILLDIHLADGASFEIFNHVKVKTPVIFTTAYDQYAIKAFEVNAIDYLLKPIKRKELSRAIDKFIQLSSNQSFDYQHLAQLIQKKPQERRFLIRMGQQIKLIQTSDIAYCYTEERITFIMTNAGRRYPVDHSLEKLGELLPDDRFFRINRQFIIGLHAVKEMYAYSKARVKLILIPNCDIQTIVSTERSPVFRRWLNTD